MDRPLPIHCPRCGYDLGGVVASWTEACPVGGICSECGLGFEWREVLNPRHTYAKWSFEHTGGVSARRMLTTFAVSLLPRRFWSAVRMEHAIVWRRLAVYVGGSLLLSYLALGACAALFVIYCDRSPLVGSPTGLWMLRQPRNLVDSVLMAMAWPIGDLGVGMYGEFEPLAPGTAWFVTTCGMLVWTLLMPAVFVLLTDTLRGAGVRAAHLWRVLAYLVVIVLAVRVVRGAAALAEEADLPGAADLAGVLAGPLVWVARGVELLFVPFALVWWWRVVKLYLRLPHAMGVALAVWLISGLLMLVAFVGLAAMQGD